MPLLVLPFPAFDPILVSFGPFAVRWYALAYIVGILLGWYYARVLIRNSRLWGGQAPLTVVDFDDFILWVTLGIILGGRTGYVLFYNLPHFASHPSEIIEVWKGGMSFHGGFLGCVLAVVLFAWKRGISFLSLGDLTCAAAPIGICLGRIANFVNGELWGRPSDVPWAMVFPGRRTRCRAIRARFMRRHWKALLLFALLAIAIRAGALRRPGLIIGLFAIVYAIARSFCETFPRAGSAIGFPVGRSDHGHAAFGAAVRRRRWLCYRCPAPAATACRNDSCRVCCRLKPKFINAFAPRVRCRSANSWQFA